jgi:Fe-S-cluster containining protein
MEAGEAERMAAHLGLELDEFIRRFTRLNRQRSGLSLDEKPDGSCVFLDGDDCRVQPVKPRQCRGFPNLWDFPGFDQVCRAKPRDVSADEWRRRIERDSGVNQPAGGDSCADRPG